MSRPELERLAELVREATGNVIAPERYASLGEAVERRAAASGGRSVEAYVEALAAGRLPHEWEPLVALVTIKESYFLRTPLQFESLARDLLPGLLAARAETRTLRIWSAACAKGEEPASVAMVLAEQPALADWKWSILATDLDAEALGHARQGLYGERAVGQLDPGRLDRWFRRRGRIFELAPEIQARIDYRQLNLSRLPLDLAERGFDLVLLRNVLIYFRPLLRQRLLADVASRLAPHGWLAVGASETIWQLQEDFEAVPLGECFWYRPLARDGAAAAHRPVDGAQVHRMLRKAVGGNGRQDSARGSDSSRPAGGASPSTAAGSIGAEVSGVRRASDAGPRAGGPDAPPLVAGRTGPGPPAIQTERRNAAAADPVGEPSPVSAAARALADDRLDEAREQVARALSADATDPAAHALKGLLADLEGRLTEALVAYRAALYVAPDLFQVRLLLADALLRHGEKARAHRHYREILAALAAGAGSPLTLAADLPLPDREGTLRRCRAALAAG